MEVARLVHSTQNKKLVMFVKHTKKKVLQLFLCSILMQNIQMQPLWASSHILCYLLSDNSCETFLGKSCSGIKKMKIKIFLKFFQKNLANTRQGGACPKK